MGRKKALQIVAAQKSRLAELAAAQARADAETSPDDMGTDEPAEIGPHDVVAWPEQGKEGTGSEEVAGQAPSRPDGLE